MCDDDDVCDEYYSPSTNEGDIRYKFTRGYCSQSTGQLQYRYSGTELPVLLYTTVQYTTIHTAAAATTTTVLVVLQGTLYLYCTTV